MSIHIQGAPGPDDGSNLEFAKVVAPKIRELFGTAVILSVGEEQVTLDTVEKFDRFLELQRTGATPVRSFKMRCDSETDLACVVQSAQALLECFGVHTAPLIFNGIPLSVTTTSNFEDLKLEYLDRLGFENLPDGSARIFPQVKLDRAGLFFGGLAASKLTGKDVVCVSDRSKVLLKPSHNANHVNGFIYNIGDNS